jgi:RHS repeat-associated protein
VVLSYSVGSFSNGFYKLVSFTPPNLPPATYGYDNGQSNNYELTSVTTSYGGMLEFVYANHDFYFNTTKLDSKVVSQKRISFNQGENAQIWNYVYPTYQGVSSGTATVDGPEFDTSATHYAYESVSANRWRIGLETSLALSDGSYSASWTWTYHEISTTSWSVLGVNMGTAKGPLVSSATASPIGDSTLRRDYDYLRGGSTSVKRYGLPTKISYFVNGSPSAKSYKELAYYYETHTSFQYNYMLSYVESMRDKSGAGTLLRETINSYFDETGKWGALKQTKRWKTGTTNPIYYIWDFAYSRDASNVTISVDGPGEAGVTQVKYQYGIEKEVSTPGFLKYTRTISKYGYVVDERNQYKQTRSYIYDDLGRPTTVELRHWGQGQPEPNPFLTISYLWRPSGANQVEIAHGNNLITQYWDGMGRKNGTIESGDDTTIYHRKQLDAEGRTKTVEAGSTTDAPKYSYLYDALGRTTRITDSLGEYTTIAYSAHTRTITDPENHSSVYNYADFPGLPTTLTDAQNHAANYTYDPVGRLTTVSYLGRTQSYSYDGLDHIASETHPETNLIEYTYDLANRLYKKSWGGVDNIYNYNSSGQVLSVIGAETVTYEYDDKGAVSSITGASGWTRSGITYNDFGAVTHETVLIPGLGSKSLSYEYDAEGNLTKTVYPDGKEAVQAFNGLGRPETLTFNSSSIITSASYGPNKIPASISAGNGTTLSSTFYANGAPHVVTLMRGSMPLYNADYDYDGAGNITGISSSAPAPALNSAFAYDSLNRLTSATYSTGDQGKPLTYSYNYDAYGNMLTVRHDGGIVFNKTYNAKNQIDDMVNYQYDARGNLTAANGRAFLWDAQNRLKAVTDASGQFMAEYAYDDRGLRIATLAPNPDIDIVNYSTGSGADFTCNLQSECYITFTIFNRGYNYLNLNTPSISGQNMAMFSVTQQPASSVYPGQSTQMTIKFNPTSVGDKTALVSIASNDPDLSENPYLITLHGYCVPDITVSGVQGGTYDFGTVAIGESSRHVFTARNVGTATLLLYGTPTIEQSGGGLDFYYEQEGGAWPSLISANGSALFAVRFAPTAEGQRMATLTIASSDPDENPYTITLIGTGQNGPDKVVDESELTLLSPAGGDTLAAGSFHDIRWSGGERVKCVKLEYSNDNGSTFRTIADRVANIGNFPWKVPDELSSSCLIRVSDADGAPVVPVIISFKFNFRVSATADKVPEGSTYFAFRAGVPDLRTQTYQVADVAFSPDGLRGTENLLFNDALAEIPSSASFLGRWHQARITYDMTRYAGSVWIDNALVLGDIPLRQDFGVQAQPEISISRAVSLPIMLWVDDMEVGFRDISFLGKDPNEVEPRRLFSDNFNSYETALFPRQGGWIDRGDESRQADKLKAESVVENSISSKAAETGERAVAATIDDQVYASSSKSFRLEKSNEEPVAAAKRFSIPERIPYCVSGEPFAIVAAGEKGQSERPLSSTRDSEKEPKRQKRWDDRETDRTGSASDRRESANMKRAAVKPRSSDAGTKKNTKMVSGIPATGTFYIYAFDGRLLAEYNVEGQLVREYIYFCRKLMAEYRNQESRLLYYAADQINSTRMVTDSTGAVVYAAAHEPYGEIQKTWVSAYDPSLKFSSNQRDAESDLDYFGARYYDRSQFRFISVDPAISGGAGESNFQRWNLYAYCGSNPVCNVDPDGRMYIVFERYERRLYVYDDNNQLMATFPASNIAEGGSFPNGIWKCNGFRYTDENPNDRFGPWGFYSFDVNGNPNYGLHAGRQFDQDGYGGVGWLHATNGCIRTIPEAMLFLLYIESTGDKLKCLVVTDVWRVASASGENISPEEQKRIMTDFRDWCDTLDCISHFLSDYFFSYGPIPPGAIEDDI